MKKLPLFLPLLFLNAVVSGQIQLFMKSFNPVKKDVVSALEDNYFTLTSNALHPNGFYFNAYYKANYKTVTLDHYGDFFLQWEETLGAETTGDLQLTRYEAWIKISSLENVEAVATIYKPGRDVASQRKYASLRFSTGSKPLIRVYKTTFEVNNGTKTQLSSNDSKVAEVDIPFMKLGDCDECAVPAEARALIKKMDELKDLLNTDDINVRFFDEERFKSDLLGILKLKEAKEMVGDAIDKEITLPDGMPQIAFSFFQSKLPFYTFESVVDEFMGVFNLRGAYYSRESPELLNKITRVLNNLKGYKVSINNNKEEVRSGNVLKTVSLFKGNSDQPVLSFFLMDNDHVSFRFFHLLTHEAAANSSN